MSSVRIMKPSGMDHMIIPEIECGRDLSVSYFDCTNYYFDIGRSDVDTLDEEGRPVDKNGNSVPAKYRKRGPEKTTVPILSWKWGC